MASRKPSAPMFEFVDIQGRKFGDADALRKAAPRTPASKSDSDAADRLAPSDFETILDGLAIAGWRRGQTALTSLLRALEFRRADGPAFTGADVGAALRHLHDHDRVVAGHGEGWYLTEAAADERLRQLFARPQAKAWWKGWLYATVSWGDASQYDRSPPLFQSRHPDENVALLRLLLISGIDMSTYRRFTEGPFYGLVTVDAAARALRQVHRLGLVGQVDARIHWHLIAALDHQGVLARAHEVSAWVDAHLDEAPAGDATALRLRAAELRLHRGDRAGVKAAIGRDAAALPFLPLFESLLDARDGRWADAAASFPKAWKELTAHLGKRRGIAPQTMLQLYPLALMAQPDAKAWSTAHRFCIAMSGSRDPSPHDDWGRWAHVLAVRLGDARLAPGALDVAGQASLRVDADERSDRVILAAWLGQAPKPSRDEPIADVIAQLVNDGLVWKAALIIDALERLDRRVPPLPADVQSALKAERERVGDALSFFAPKRDAWRDALAAITALGGGASASAAADQPAACLTWRITLDRDGRMFDLEAFEPTATGRGKPKLLTPGTLKKRTKLDARDAAVARNLRASRMRASSFVLDMAGAAVALVGHPSVEFADAPGVSVELTEGLPMLEVKRERSRSHDARDGVKSDVKAQAKTDAKDDAKDAEHFVFRLHDPLIADKEPALERQFNPYEDHNAERARRDSLRIVRDAPDRARLLRLTPAHKRVAELIAQRWTVPVDAGAELDAALRVLAGHFVLSSDAQAGEPVPSDARLVAQLQPRGDGMRLAVIARPFGDFGPALAPGHGRARLMTMRAGTSLTTERDLDAERAHFAALLEAMPFLAGAEGNHDGDATWQLDEPEDAIAAVDTLGRLASEGTAVRALEWPKGQSLRVIAPDHKAFATTLRSERDWFALEGELRVDEARVLSLRQLLGLLHEGRSSRYVALGNGEYLALADQLRQRLAELAAIGEAAGDGMKLGATSAAWLADAAAELGVKGDAAWRKRAAQLEAAAALDPALPHGLQAELRPYQHEGFVWMSRLAQAGFGAILADDMGLGKTIQTLALLLVRAAQGPALVVAPTSVCSNWADEVARFAPGLRASVYGQADTKPAGAGAPGVDRAAQVAAAQAGDVLIVSYALLLRDAEAFAAKPQGWATLVLDEAQALKNAATLRVQAVAALDAGFRLALSGTPVENRLSDLWSIMNLVNPGLLGSSSRFGERFANPIERQRNEGARARLRRLIGPFLLRRTKAQVLTDLPPRTEIVQRIEPNDDERAFLEAMRRQALERIAQLDTSDQKSRFNVLAELTRLRRAACDPRLAAPELGAIGAKVQAFERLATELVAGGHQTLVFSQFTDFLALLAQRLDAAGLRYLVLDGSTPAAVRGTRVAAFQRGEADLFLISLKAGGFGLNLTAADYVVITDPWWNPAAEDQAMGRAHRIGQQRPVTVYRLVTAGSIEERIVGLHHDKRELAEGLLADQDTSAPLAAQELIDLLRV